MNVIPEKRIVCNNNQCERMPHIKNRQAHKKLFELLKRIHSKATAAKQRPKATRPNSWENKVERIKRVFLLIKTLATLPCYDSGLSILQPGERENTITSASERGSVLYKQQLRTKAFKCFLNLSYGAKGSKYAGVSLRYIESLGTV